MVRLSSYFGRAQGLLASLAICAVGCADTADSSLNSGSAALSVPVPTVDQYVILASHGVSLDDRSVVSGGDIGVSPGTGSTLNSLTAGHDSRLAVGQVVLAQKVVLEERTVAGELGATTIVAPRAKTGPRSAYIAPPAPPTPGSFTAGHTDIDVSRGRTRNLVAGKYDSVNVYGALFLSGGVYEIRSLRLGNDARVIALAPSTVRIVGGLSGGDRASLTPALNLGAGDLRVSVAGTLDGRDTSVSLGHDFRLRAVVVAAGKFRADDRLFALGAIAARDVILDHDCKVVFEGGFECSAGTSCDDGNGCTTDACVDTKCAHDRSPDGTACSDGNACTQMDTCQAGACAPGGAVVCPPGDQCHAAGVCNPATGVCSGGANKPDGTVCDDGNVCTQPDVCRAGMCGGAPLPNCPPQQQADLAIAKTVDNAAPQVGAVVTFTVTLFDIGPGAASGVQVTDLLPAGLVFVSATPSQGSFDSTTGIWTVGSVAAGGSVGLQLAARVASPSPLTNIAAVTHADQGDPDTANNSASATVTPQQADLAVAKTVDNASPQVGDAINFTVTLSNLGPAVATGVTVTDLLPAGLTFLSATPSQGSFLAGSGLWTVGVVQPGIPQVLHVLARVASPNAATNVAVISHADQFDPNNGNNSASATETAQQADLSLTKTVDRPTATVGDLVTFTVTLSNNGPGAGTGVQVTDLLPASLAFVSATPSAGTYNSGTGAWNVGTVTAGGSQTLQLVAQVLSPGASTNTATIAAADEFDPDTANNSASATTNGSPQQADLALTKAVDNAAPQVGGVVTFTVTLSNNGPGAATGVQVTDLLPAGLTFVSATPSAGSYNASTGLWVVGALTAGGSQTLQISAQVASAGAQTNTATISGADQGDPDTGNNTASATESPQQADLALTKTVDDPTANVGDTVTFTIILSNNGPGAGTSVEVTDLLPAGLTFVSATPSAGTYTVATGVWSVGTVAAGSTQTLQIAAQVVSPNGLTNVASITHADQFDPDATNNSAAATETPEQADLALVKAVDRPTAPVGQVVTFTVTLANNGPGAATNVQVSDLLPPGLNPVSATVSAGTFMLASGVWNVGAVGAGGTQTLQLAAQVVALGPITNTASVIGADQFDPNGGNNVASATTSGTPQQADLAVTKAANPINPPVGGNVTFTVRLANNGPGPATNVQVTDLLPAGLTFVSATPSQGTFTPGSGVWNVGTVPPGVSQTLQLVAQVVTTNPVNNTATITHSDAPDPNPGNNQASVTVAPQQQVAELALGKSVDLPTPAVGARVVYTLTLSSMGPSDATNVQVTDLLPAGMTFVFASPSQGTYNPATGIWDIGTAPAGIPQILQLAARVGVTGPVTNTATITHSDQFDSNPGNNTSSATLTAH